MASDYLLLLRLTDDSPVLTRYPAGTRWVVVYTFDNEPMTLAQAIEKRDEMQRLYPDCDFRITRLLG